MVEAEVTGAPRPSPPTPPTPPSDERSPTPVGICPCSSVLPVFAPFCVIVSLTKTLPVTLMPL
jgi:hypothetical protein